jgi:hypothetical protein
MTKSATLSLNTIDYPFETLSQRAKANPPKLVLDPDFQRKYKWDKEGWGRASKFIESCLMRIPLPSCYFAEDDSRAHLVIDGVQRITTIIRFMDDKFALEGMTAFKELEGKKFSELGTVAADFESTTIRCVVLRNENPKELIAEIFSRLNKGAVELSDQEIRHALFAGIFDQLLVELSQRSTIKNFKMGKSGQATKDSREGEELVLRYFAFKETGVEYNDNLTRFLDKFMEKSLTFDAPRIEVLRQEFDASLSACQIVFNEDEIFSDISKGRNRQGIVYYDLLMNSLGEIDTKVLQDKREQIRSAFFDLCQSPDFKRLIAGGVQRKASISRRNKLWGDRLKAAIR